MAIGLTRQEQRALIGVVALILGGLAVQSWTQRRRGANPVVYVAGQGRWEKIADFAAGPTSPTLKLAPKAASISPTPLTASSPRLGVTSSSTPLATPGSLPSAEAGGIELNRATADELDRLPGIGPAKARSIVATRERLGGFSSLDELRQSPGIGPKILEKIRPYLRLGELSHKPHPQQDASSTSTSRLVAGALKAGSVAIPSSSDGRPGASSAKGGNPININTAGVEELDQLVGIGPALARRIVEDRQRRGPFARPEDLIRVAGIGPKNLAKIMPRICVR